MSLRFLRLIGLAGCLVGGSALAWTDQMEVVWPMGENDSRARAREQALDSMRLKASNAVGVIVQSSATLRGGTLREEIKTIGISMMQITNVVDTLTVGANGRAHLTVTATVMVDESELTRRAEAMRSDGQLAREVQRLQEEKNVLLARLKDASRAVSVSANGADVMAAMTREFELRGMLRTNEARVGNTFHAGALLDLAEQDEVAWLRERDHIDREVVAAMMGSSASAILEGVERVGDVWRARVRVSWSPPLDAVSNALKPYDRHQSVQVRDYIDRSLSLGLPDSSAGYSDSPFTDRALTYLSAHSIWMEVEVGGVTGRFPVLYTEGSRCGGDEPPCAPFSMGAGYPKKPYAIKFVEQRSESAKIVGAPNGTNPVSFALSKTQAAAATGVSASFVLRRPDGSEVRRAVANGLAPRRAADHHSGLSAWR